MLIDNPHFVDKYLSAGFFTHCYLEAGYLHKKDPLIQIFRAKDDRNYVFDLASITKALVTAPLAFKYFDLRNSLQSSLSIRDLSIKGREIFFPDNIESLKINDILAHRAGLPAWLNFWVGQLGPQERYKNLCDKRMSHILEVLERTSYKWKTKLSDECYSDVGFIILGALLEQCTKRTLDNLFIDFMKADLGLKENRPDFCFPTPFAKKHPIYITSSYCPIRQRWLKGEVHDENCAALGGISGHAGLFGAGMRLSSYLKALAGSDLGSQFLEMNEKMRVDNAPLLGMRQADDHASSQFCQGAAIGHWGFTGTGFWLQTSSSRYVIVLTNRVISGRLSPQTKIFRSEALAFLNNIF